MVTTGARRAPPADTKCSPAAQRKQAKRACILYIKMLGFFCVCLSELIEELGSHRGVKIGMWVSNDMTTIKL